MAGEHQAKVESSGPTAGQDFHLGVMLPPADRDNPDAKGVTITAVDPSGLVAQQGLERKDVKLNVNGSAVSKIPARCAKRWFLPLLKLRGPAAPRKCYAQP